MELKKDTTENTSFAYEDEGRPNPNDSLFGSMGVDNINNVEDYTGNTVSSTKKPKVPSWVWIILVVVIAVIGVLAVKILKGKNLDGAYVMTKAKVNGIEYTVEQLEAASGMTFYMRLEIDGKEGYLVMSYAGMVDDGRVDVEIDGNNIIVSREGNELEFQYDSSEDVIIFENDGASIILERLK